MPKTLTLIIGENGQLNAVPGGDIRPIEAAWACQQAAMSFLDLVVQEQARPESEEADDAEG